MAAQTMTREEFAARFRKKRYIAAKYRSEDTVPTGAVTLPSLHGTFALSILLAQSYPHALAAIQN
jgi:hypothetical protein